MASRTTIALVVLGALASAVALDVVREEPAAVGVPLAEHGASARSAARESPIDLAAVLRRERFASELAGDPFAGREVLRPAAAATAPPPQVPPPFAYRYGGQFRIDTGGWRVYLLKGNDLVPISVGDVLEGSYKVTAIGAEEFELVHLPSATTRVLQYSSLGTGSALAQGDQAPQSLPAGAARLGASASLATSSGNGSAEGRAATPSAAGSGALVGVPMTSGVGTSPGVASSSGSVTGGAVPRGTLGAPAPAASAPRLGVAPPASGSMPMSPAPAGTMQTLPAPTGRLGV